jgi:alpha-N-acetylglucosamine transferase
VLYESLRASGSTRDFVVLVLENHYVSPKILDLLRENGAIVKESEGKVVGLTYLRVAITVPLTVQSNIPRWKLAFSKLRIFDETEYTKLVWIDADDIILQNIDDLFDYPDISAPPDFNACQQRADRISSGIMVVEPKSDKFWKLYDFLEESDQTSNIRNDQDLINKVFTKKTILPEVYGPFVERCHCQNAIPMSQAKTGLKLLSFNNQLRAI